MKVIGLLGGVASGKSWVAEQLKELGAGILDGDRAGHEVLRLAEVEQQVRERWGANVFDAQGRVDRKALARIVFAPGPDGPRELEHLEQITHPRIKARLEAEIAAHAAAGLPAVVLDAPVMVKAGWDRLCDEIWLIDAPREVRLARALGRGWSEEEFDRREAAQESLDLKLKRADRIINNSGTPHSTLTQVTHLWRLLLAQ